MLAARIYAEEVEVDRRLQGFGVTREELIRIVREVVAARADAVEDDPVTAGGLFAYIYGTRHLRGVFRQKKWLRHRQENIEAVKHPGKDLRIVYQSVDLATSWIHNPRAISGKGSGADRAIDLAQGSLFTDEELNRLNPTTIEAINTGVWFFCVSVDGEDVRAELSLPASIEGRNFKDFIERIFIVAGGQWEGAKVTPIYSADVIEFEPKVTRK
jgi:hypothetical protein